MRTIPRHLLACSLALLLTGAGSATAQERLTGLRSIMLGPTFEMWSLSGDVYQFTEGSADSLLVADARQWSVPVSVFIPVGRRWSVDVAAAWASSEVTIGEGSSEETLSLSGATDTRIRVTGRFANENVLLTFGMNAPSGATSLDDEELAVLRIVGAPALGAQIPTLGTGVGGTAGIVFAREVASWAWAFGASYELRGEYAPIAVSGGIATPDFNPSDVVHLSLGTNGLLGQHEMTLGLSADIFADDKLTGGPAGAASPTTRLGPIYTLEWEMRFAAPRFRELALSVVERYRTAYERDGEKVDDSAANYLDVALRSAIPVGRETDVVLALAGRHHTGLDSDRSIASAALASGMATLGIAHGLGGGFVLAPFVRGQLGTIESAGGEADLTGFAAGITLGRRF